MCAQGSKFQNILLNLGKIITNKTGKESTGDELAKLASDVRANLILFFDSKGLAPDTPQQRAVAADTEKLRKDWKMDYDDFYRESYLRGIRANANALHDQGEWSLLEAKLKELAKEKKGSEMAC
ncbi:MAG: hypothetical protein Q8P54_02360 [bacterium]|nr:hypothetical protein [bacterium]